MKYSRSYYPNYLCLSKLTQKYKVNTKKIRYEMKPRFYLAAMNTLLVFIF